MKKPSRKPHSTKAHILLEHSRSRRLNRGGNLLGLIVLILLALIFMARRIMIAANPRRTAQLHEASSEGLQSAGEELSPADWRALDNLIQNSAHL